MHVLYSVFLYDSIFYNIFPDLTDYVDYLQGNSQKVTEI